MSGASATLDAIPFLKGFANLGLEAIAMEMERVESQVIVARAQSLVHVGGADDPKAGETRESLQVLGEGVDALGGWIDIGSLLEKAFYEEFGSIHGPAVMFLRIAIAEAMAGRVVRVSWAQMQRPKPTSRQSRKR